jgi:N-acyl-D-aspartate/D-glutamate deacylase
MLDLAITGGEVVDGTGGPRRRADVGIADGRVVTIGRVEDEARETIDATGLLVTPGFVDVHTHYDGQVTWDPMLTPSSWHGVTTLLMGNCGVGFAPVVPERRDWLIGLMEGVEAIPGAALSEGIRWSWESFPEFLDALDGTDLALDVGAQVPHGAVRAYVMGDRGARNEPATPDDIAEMARIVAEAVDAGAVGVSTSRTIVHRAVDGEPVPGTFAAEDELFALGRALARVGRGVFELAPAGIQGEDLAAPDKELDWMRRLAKETQRPVTYGFVQHDVAPDDWKRLLDLAGAAVDDDVPLRPQVAGRPIGLLLGLQTFHPLSSRPTFAATAARATSLDDLVARLSDPSVRERILGEEPAVEMPAYIALTFDRIFELGDPPDYEPARDESIAARAARAEVPADAMFYDLLLGRAGRQLLLRPLLGYSDFTLEPLREMLEHPASVLGIGDGGAHVRAICDASNPTFMLTHWVRDRTRGPRLPLEMVIHKMTGNNADLYGLHDRGTIAVGKKADLNVIDLAALRLHSPEFVNDLPADAGRLVQGASGYRATIVSGETIRRDGTDTGARPGRLVRSRS